MQKLIILIFICFATLLQAQTPQAINYQAVARDANGKELADGSKINLKFTVLDAGNAVYSETHSKVATKLGLYNVLIGKGTTNDDFSLVKWSNPTSKSIKIETDFDNDGLYDLESTSQLVSVPYALFAQAAVERQKLKIVGSKLFILDADGKDLNSVTLPGANYTGGDGIQVVDGAIINTKPDKTVTIIGTGGVLVTGTYPNFTVYSDKYVAGSGIGFVSKGGGTYEIDNTHKLSILGNTLKLSPTDVGVQLPSGGNQWKKIGNYYRFTDNQSTEILNTLYNFDGVVKVSNGLFRLENTDGGVQLYSGSVEVTGQGGWVRINAGSSNSSGSINVFGTSFQKKNCTIDYLDNSKDNGYLGINLQSCNNNTTNYSVVTMYKDFGGRGHISVSKDDCTGFFGAAMYFDDKNYTPGKWVVTAQVKSYKEDHPTDPTKDVWNASVEGDEVAQYTRGTATLKNGRVQIQLPEIFSLMIEEGTMTVQITPNDENSLGLCTKNKTLKGFEVVELGRGTGNYTFDYEVKAVRKGYKNFKVIRDKVKMPSAAMPENIDNLKNNQK